jgi:hypothetical protein
MAWPGLFLKKTCSDSNSAPLIETLISGFLHSVKADICCPPVKKEHDGQIRKIKIK